MLSSVRQSVRGLLKSPIFTLTTVISLGVGIGACTAVFAVVRASFFAELPYTEPSRLVELWSTPSPRSRQRIDLIPSDRVATWLQDDFVSLQGLAARGTVSLVLEGEAPRRIEGEAVSGGFFELMGVPSLIGRTLTTDDDRLSAEPAVVLSEPLWREHFAGSASALGTVARLSGVAYTIVGVMPKRFEVRSLAWVPSHAFMGPGMAAYTPVGRLRQGASLEEAVVEVQRRAALEHAADSTLFGGMGAVALALGQASRVDSSMLWVITGTVAALFLLALTNLTTLFLVRAGERGRATAVRLALGASRRQVGAALLLESLLLALAGAVTGLLLAVWGTDLIRAAMGGQFQGPVDPILDGPAFAFTAGLSGIAALLVGLEPLRHLRNLDLRGLMQGGSAMTTFGAAQRRTRDFVLSVQVALIVVFACVSGVLTISYRTYAGIDLGYDSDRVVTAFPDYAVRPMTPEQQLELGAAMVARLDGYPGSEGATYWRMGTQSYPSRPKHDAVFEGGITDFPARAGLYRYYDVGPDFFRVLGIPIVAGRAFGPGDGPGSPAVGIITAQGAAVWWPGQDPVGRRVKLGEESEWITVVGVARDAADLHQEGRGFAVGTVTRGHQHLPLLYRPGIQRRTAPIGWIDRGAIVGTDGIVVAVRAASRTDPLEETLTAEMAAIAPNLPLRRVGTLEDWQLDGYLGSVLRLYRALLLTVAGAGFSVALLGVSGAVSDALLRRTREMGIRKALGARPHQVTWSLVRGTLVAVFLGVAFGLVLVTALGTVVADQSVYRYMLLGNSILDWRVLSSVATTVVLVALCSSALWARRAARVEPAAALRVD